MTFASLRQLIRSEYSGNLRNDLQAGLTTAVIALPLALAFGIASGVEAKYGLYTAIVAGIVAAIFGGSKVQVSGPTGGMAAVLITVSSQFGYEKTVLIGLLAGAFQIAAGFLKLGRFAKMLPFPLIAGFTMGIGIIIFGGQIDHILGLRVHHQHPEFFDRMGETFFAILHSGINLRCLLLGAAVILGSVFLPKLNKKLPAALLSIVGVSLVSWTLGFDIAHVRDIPRTLPVPHFPSFSWEMFRELLRPAATVAALGAIESLLAAVVADNMLADGSKHDSNRELVGQGLANGVTSFFGGIPCTGAIARTAVNISSGGRTRVAAIFHSVVLFFVMFFLAPMATAIPISALAGVLILTSIRMVEWREVRWLMSAPKSDIAIMVITVLVTVFTDLVMAVEFGLIAASVLFIQKMSSLTPQLVEPHEEGATQSGRTRVFRMPGPLFWGDSHAIIEAIEACEDVDTVVLNMQNVTHIDASGVSTLREAKHFLDKQKIRLCLVGTPARTLQIMTDLGTVAEIQPGNIFRTEAELQSGLKT